MLIAFRTDITDSTWLGRLPGCLLTGFIALTATVLRGHLGLQVLSPAILAALSGLLIGQIFRISVLTESGIAFSTRTLLRLAVALLGVQISFQQIFHAGWAPFIIVAIVLFTSFCFVTVVGRWLGVNPKLTQLIAAGTSVCGAAAVAATNSVTEASDDDVTYAVAMVTVFGTALMLLAPAAAAILGLTEAHFGLWAGASIHEVAQVAGATAQVGAASVQTGTIAKLTRVVLLVPVVLILGYMKGRQQASTPAKVQFPLFVLAFLSLAALASFAPPPAQVKHVIANASAFLLAMALAGMGLRIRMADLAHKGWRPAVLAGLATVFISLFSLALVSWFD